VFQARYVFSKVCSVSLVGGVNGHAINEISLQILHCIVSSEAQFKT